MWVMVLIKIIALTIGLFVLYRLVKACKNITGLFQRLKEIKRNNS